MFKLVMTEPGSTITLETTDGTVLLDAYIEFMQHHSGGCRCVLSIEALHDGNRSVSYGKYDEHGNAAVSAMVASFVANGGSTKGHN